MLLRILIALLCSAAIGWAGYRRGSLTADGALGAVIVGTLTLGLGGWAWGLLVIIFFISSSLLSHAREAEKQSVAEDKFSKGNRRDLWQALANGGVAALLALINAISPSPLLFAGAIGALATAAADTWATEIGVLSKGRPRLVTTGRAVAPGTSGAISPLGTLATLAGGLTIGASAWALAALGLAPVAAAWWMPLAGLLGGLAGSLFDSLLGATAQRVYRCPTCNSETERTVHRCGTPTIPLRGLSWLENDLVNLLSTAVGAGVALLPAVLLP